jgi:hypothetical protein
MKDHQIDIILKAWTTYQELIRGFGENCWKIRTFFYTASFGVIAAAFTTNVTPLYWAVPPICVAFFSLELGYRRLQEQYISKTLEIERTINDILVGQETPVLPDGGISTGLDTPRLRDVLQFLKPKRYLFWFSYLIVFLIALALYSVGVVQSGICPPPSAAQHGVAADGAAPRR